MSLTALRRPACCKGLGFRVGGLVFRVQGLGFLKFVPSKGVLFFLGSERGTLFGKCPYMPTLASPVTSVFGVGLGFRV